MKDNLNMINSSSGASRRNVVLGAGAAAAVAGVGAVQDVVMDERSEVDEFDDAGAANQGVGRRAARAGAERE